MDAYISCGNRIKVTMKSGIRALDFEGLETGIA